MNKLNKLRAAIKSKDGWWASLFAGPLANRLLEPICEITWISPNLITVTSLFIGLLAALCFAQGEHLWLILGGILVQLSFVVDCMDGQLARYRQQFSNLGAWLDRVSDRFKDFLYIFSLAWGFTQRYNPDFYFGLRPVQEFITLLQFQNPFEAFTTAPWLQAILMFNWVIPSQTIWPIAMFALGAVFMIDYYVNQDMKLEALPAKSSSSAKRPSKNLLSSILSFGLKVYKSIPILRFNIGEQALLISLFAACDLIFSLLLLFACLGSFYVVYYPITRLYGFSPEK